MFIDFPYLSENLPYEWQVIYHILSQCKERELQFYLFRGVLQYAKIWPTDQPQSCLWYVYSGFGEEVQSKK